MKKEWIFYIGLAIFFFIWGNWILSFTSPDEGKNVSVVLHMLKTRDFLIPYYNCHLRLEKPPLLYWIIALFSTVSGLNEFTARLVSGISAIGIAFFTYLIAKEEISEETGKYAFLILLTFPHMWVEARAVVPEMLLTFFMTAGIYYFLKRNFILGWIMLALAFLTKGPVGVILPVTVFLVWKKELKIFNPAGIFLFIILGGSWYFYMFKVLGFFYFKKFFLYENIYRYLEKMKAHPYPFYYYIPVLLIASIFYVPVYYKIFKKLKEKNFPQNALPFLYWFGIVFLFYSLAKNKLHHYLLFAYPPLAIIFACFVNFEYIKKVMGICIVVLFILLLEAVLIEQDRFVKRVSPYLKSYTGPLYFYRYENSAIVFYAGRCIPVIKNPSKIKGGLVITPAVYKDVFPFCKEVFKGKEFGKKLVLLKCISRGTQKGTL